MDTYAEAMDGVAIDEQLGMKDDDNLSATDGGYTSGINAYRRQLKAQEAAEEKAILLQEFVYHQLQKEVAEMTETATKSVAKAKEEAQYIQQETTARRSRRQLSSVAMEAMESLGKKQENKEYDITDLHAFAREYETAHVKKLQPLEVEEVRIATHYGFRQRREERERRRLTSHAATVFGLSEL